MLLCDCWVLFSMLFCGVSCALLSSVVFIYFLFGCCCDFARFVILYWLTVVALFLCLFCLVICLLFCWLRCFRDWFSSGCWFVYWLLVLFSIVNGLVVWLVLAFLCLLVLVDGLVVVFPVCCCVGLCWFCDCLLWCLVWCVCC